MDNRSRLQDLIPKLVLAPSFLIVLIFVYGFIAYTGFLSMTDSKMLPSYNFVGLSNYAKLWALPHWWRAVSNLAIFAALYIAICSILGLGLAILLDQKIRAEGFLRPIYLYPMALSFIVTGTAWKWFLDPGIGLENTMHLWGWESFSFNWIKDRNYAIYCVVIAAVWQSTGFIMAMFLAGLRGVDNEIIKAAQIDGAPTSTIYRRIIIPLAKPGIIAGCILVFIPALGAYITPIMLGGGKNLMIGNLISLQFGSSRNWPFGSAAALILMAFVMVALLFYVRITTRERRHLHG